MRIIAGQLKGRRLDGPTWDGLRPTSDRLRETMFNVLGQTLDGLTVLDAFAGAGALGIEALSRGAARVTFVERDPRAVALITRNVAHCGVESSCAIVRADFLAVDDRLAALNAFDLILLDPPYDIADMPRVLQRAGALATSGARVVLEHRRAQATPDVAGPLRRWRVVPSGDSALSLYRLE